LAFIEHGEAAFFGEEGAGDIDTGVGEGAGAGGPAVSHEKPKEEAKQPAADQGKPVLPAAQQKKPAGFSLPVGEHIFKGSYLKDGETQPLEFVFKVEDGGIIST
jgi:hypothetical protein